MIISNFKQLIKFSVLTLCLIATVNFVNAQQVDERPAPRQSMKLTQDQIKVLDQVPFYIVEYDGSVEAMGRLEQALNQGVGTIRHRYQTIPYVAIKIDAPEFEAAELELIPGIIACSKDGYSVQNLTESHAQTQALLAQEKGGTGEGCGIAILDSGIDDRHCMFDGKLTRGSACFSTDFTFPGFFTSINTCPRGIDGSTTDPTLANSYEVVQFFPDHGSNVAGIAAGAPCQVANLSLNPPAFDANPGGVASGAHIIPVNVFSEFSGFFNGALSYTSDQIAGLDYLLANKDALDLCAVNMSLGGGGPEATPCADGARQAVIDALTSAGVAVVIATGNDGFNNGVSFPACIQSAIAVGAVDDAGARAGFSNHLDGMVDLFAPGVNVNSAISNLTVNPFPFSFTADFTGTSMATPTVAGAFAILKARHPDATVATMLNALQQTGAPVPGFSTPSIRILDACLFLDAQLNPVPTMGEWGLMSLGLLLLIVGVVTIKSRKLVFG